MVNKTEIRAFLHDAKAVSPAIATLILIVIAAVAAAGVGILVQSSQKNAQDQTADKDMSVMGTIVLKGSTTVLPVSQAGAEAFMKKNPAVDMKVSGGGSTEGRMYVYTKTVDIGASSAIWPTTETVTDGVTVPGRGVAIIQDAGADATIWETKIGTGMIVVAGNIYNSTGVAVKTINVLPGAAGDSAWAADGNTLNITHGDMQALYTAGTLDLTNPSPAVKLEAVQRSDPSGTEETFADWLGNKDGTTKQLTSAILATPKQGNQGIRDYVAGAPTTPSTGRIGFVDIGFAKGGVNGNDKVIPAVQNGVANGIASKDTKGVAGKYDTESITVTGVTDVTKQKGLARDLFYYSQGIPTGAVKAYLDWITSVEGQKIVQAEGFFSV